MDDAAPRTGHAPLQPGCDGCRTARHSEVHCAHQLCCACRQVKATVRAMRAAVDGVSATIVMSPRNL